MLRWKLVVAKTVICETIGDKRKVGEKREREEWRVTSSHRA